MKYTRKLPLLFTLIVILFLTISLSVQAQGNPHGTPPGLERAIEVQNRNSPALMALQNVVGTAVTRGPDGQAAVAILTRSGGNPAIPNQLEGVSTVVVETGEFYARQSTTDRWPRPVPIGISIGHPAITAGTLGTRVTNGSQVFILSNNHVIANNNAASIGDPIIQPGTYDGGSTANDVIGNLADFEPIVFRTNRRTRNIMDAAIASTTAGQVGTATPSNGYGTPSQTVVGASLGMGVQKYGRTTGFTSGTIQFINATVTVCYSEPSRCNRPRNNARFVEQIIIYPGTFSAGGDSGSLIVTADGNNNPVALLFAGSESYTIASPIQPILNRFGVVIDN